MKVIFQGQRERVKEHISNFKMGPFSDCESYALHASLQSDFDRQKCSFLIENALVSSFTETDEIKNWKKYRKWTKVVQRAFKTAVKVSYKLPVCFLWAKFRSQYF